MKISIIRRVATQIKPKKKRKKNSPKLKFAVAFGFFVFCGIFRFFSVFSVFRGTFSVFYGLNFDKKFQPFKNHVNNDSRSWEAKNCLLTHLMPKEPCKCLIKAIITNKNHLTRTT